MMLAAGPYTLEDDLTYAPLEALVDVVLNERPDILILVSIPFNFVYGLPILMKWNTAWPFHRLATSEIDERGSHADTGRDLA